jgi:hypothetical protein
MLILDKQKAVERIVALTSVLVAAEPEQSSVRERGRGSRRLATYERRPAATEPAPVPEGRSERRRRRLAQAGEVAPA